MWACNMNANTNTNAAAKFQDENNNPERKGKRPAYDTRDTGMVLCGAKSSNVQHLNADAHDGRVLLAHAH